MAGNKIVTKSQKGMRDTTSNNICVIGGAWFLGSHLVDYLIEEKKCKVLVLDNLITGLRKHIHKNAKFIWSDIRNEGEELTKIFADNEIEYFFNYAAEPYIPESFLEANAFFWYQCYFCTTGIK